MIINNKQVNIWRGLDAPPTIYHIWIYNDSEMRIYTGEKWETFINDQATLERINEVLDQIQRLESEVDTLLTKTINGKLISGNPVFNGDDILTNKSGTFIKSSDSLSNSLISIDTLLSTQIIE